MGAPSLNLFAAFGAGIAAWEAVVHASLLINRQSPRLFGIRLAPRLNAVQSVVPALVAIGLARFALAKDERPPFAIRWLARGVLGSGSSTSRSRLSWRTPIFTTARLLPAPKARRSARRLDRKGLAPLVAL